MITMRLRLASVLLTAIAVCASAASYVWRGQPTGKAVTAAVAPQAKPDVPPPAARDDAAIVKPTFDLIRVERSGEAVIAGLSGPGWQVELISNGEVLGRARANPEGEWVIVPDRPLAARDQILTIRAVSPDGRHETSSQQSIVVGDIGAAEQPVVMLSEPARPSAVIQKPEPAPPQDVRAADAPERRAATPPEPDPMPLAIETVEYEEAGKLHVTGRAGVGATLRAYLNDTFLRDLLQEKSRNFVFSLDALLPIGSYRVRIDLIEPASGRVLSRVEVPFERDPKPPVRAASPESPLVQAAADAMKTEESGPAATPEPALVQVAADAKAEESGPTAGIGALRVLGGVAMGGSGRAVLGEPKVVVIRRGDNLWRISRKSYGSGYRYTTIYRANRDQIRDPDLIFPAQIFVLPLPDSPPG